MISAFSPSQFNLAEFNSISFIGLNGTLLSRFMYTHMQQSQVILQPLSLSLSHALLSEFSCLSVPKSQGEFLAGKFQEWQQQPGLRQNVPCCSAPTAMRPTLFLLSTLSSNSPNCTDLSRDWLPLLYLLTPTHPTNNSAYPLSLYFLKGVQSTAPFPSPVSLWLALASLVHMVWLRRRCNPSLGWRRWPGPGQPRV